MRIVADQAIPLIAEACAALGDILLKPGPSLRQADLAEADCLFVRSVTRVGPDLLAGTPVGFVGTATSGTDHIDASYLADAGIALADAAGSNANSVAEYVISGLLHLAEKQQFLLAEKTLAIVGVGHVGCRVQAKAEGLGMRVRLNDPPRARAAGEAGFVSLDEALSEADIVTLHVPLTRTGPDPTWHLADSGFFSALPPGAIFVNTSRGDVCDEDALKAAMQTGRLGGVILDVWQNEPAIDTALLKRVDLGTPHIAGYSFDGKIQATRLVADAARRHFGQTGTWHAEAHLPEPAVPSIHLDSRDTRRMARLEQALHAADESRQDALDDQRALLRTIRRVWNIANDDLRLRRILGLPPARQAERFASLRAEYGRRREWHQTRIHIPPALAELGTRLCALGFSPAD